MVGKTISHYKILEKVGEGGMGVVYKAGDTKLHRTVALRFLCPDALASEELKTRFLHEAEAAAALDHPNICTVYEIDDADEQTFVSMAYVEGRVCRTRSRSVPCPWRKLSILPRRSETASQRPTRPGVKNGLEAHVEAVTCIPMVSRGPKKEIPVKSIVGPATTVSGLTSSIPGHKKGNP
jgi:hypothetical protein